MADTARHRAGAPEVEEDALELGNVLAKTPMIRYGGIAAAVILLLIAIIAGARGRRRQLTLNVNLRR